MNKNYHLLKLAAYELNYNNDLIKSAGIIDKIVSFVKSILDSDFRNQKQQFERELAPIKEYLSNIYISSKNIQEAIDSSDFLKYKSELEALKEQANLLVEKTIDLTKLNANLHQSAKDIANDELRKKIMDKLPDNYDIDLYQPLGKPLLDFQFNKNLTVNDLQISPGNIETLNKKLSENDVEYQISSQEDKNKLKEAILAGTLMTAKLKSFDQKDKIERKTYVGETLLSITSAPVNFGDYRLQFIVDVGDQRTSIRGLNKLYLIKIKDFKKLPSAKFASKKSLAQNPQIRPYQVTQVSELDLANILLAGYKSAFGQEPTLSMLASGWAQVILESGRPVKLPNNNIGNIKATKAWIDSGKPYFVKDTQEYTSEGKFFIEKAAKWRAYDSPEEGAAGYWNLLKNRYGSSLDYFDIGDPISASVSLGKSGYYTANIEKYSTAVGKIYNEFMKKYASNFSNLIPKKDLQLPKLEVKQWKSEYQNQPSKPPANDNFDDVSDQLYNQLVANDKKISNLIKEASEDKPIIGIIKLLSGTHQERVKFATTLSALAYQHYKIKSDIKKNNQELDIIFNSKSNQYNNLEKLCSIIHEKSNNINYIVLPNFISNLKDELNISEIIL